MTREDIFAPAIEIPPEITILCLQFGDVWPCKLKSETLEYQKSIVPFNAAVLILYYEGFLDNANFIAQFLRDRKWTKIILRKKCRSITENFNGVY